MPYINVYIKSFDGLRLYGALLENEKFSDKIIICVHGFTGSGKKDFASLARTYYLNGYNVLLVDNRAHGQSEGKYVGFGVLDRLDLRNWVKYTVNRFGSNIKIFCTVYQWAEQLYLWQAVLCQKCAWHYCRLRIYKCI